MNHFEYKGDTLCCEDVPLREIAREVGTPVYVYSTATLERHYRVFAQALSGLPYLICYAVKANSNLAVLQTLFNLGAGADIVSGGELFRVIKAGGDPKKVVFSGVGKTEDEMRYALETGVLSFNVESSAELRQLQDVAQKLDKRAPVSLRINPNVDAKTHPYISTGLKQNKFGIPAEEAVENYQLAKSCSHLDVVGIDCHIGSQLTETAPFADAVHRIADLCKKISAAVGIQLRHLDLGGGLGIPYGDVEEEPPSPEDYCQTIRRALDDAGLKPEKLIFEPGRVIVGNAGTLVTRVLYEKRTGSKRFVVVDAAMNDLIRPALYQGHHPIRAVERNSDRPRHVVDVVGPICESGDFLARDRELPTFEPGEYLAVGAAGAYGFTMASNYNSRPRAAEVLVKGGAFSTIRRRETLDQLIENESLPDF